MIKVSVIHSRNIDKESTVDTKFVWLSCIADSLLYIYVSWFLDSLDVVHAFKM